MKSFLKSIVFTTLLVFTQQITLAQESEKTVTLVVSGQGKTIDEAKQNALRSAIEQAFGAFISSKTEILNDQIVSDQITSVSNGNIQSYFILNESQLPNDNWSITVNATVSINKLTSFAESKGIKIEIKGGLFAVNIKQQLLNEKAELKSICDLFGVLHEVLQASFDYSIKNEEPKAKDQEGKNWDIPLIATAVANKNMDFCANYTLKVLSSISLKQEEIEKYQSLNKPIFLVDVNYLGKSTKFYLRKQYSVDVLQTLIKQWFFYLKSFVIENGTEKINGYNINYTNYWSLVNESKNNTAIFNKNPFGNTFKEIYNPKTNQYECTTTINFLKLGEVAVELKWLDSKTLSQIEKMESYTIKANPDKSKYMLGGIVVYEKGGHGLISSLFDFGYFDLDSAKSLAKTTDLNNYMDWRIPLKTELDSLYNNLALKNIGGFNTVCQRNYTRYSWQNYYNTIYWSLTSDPLKKENGVYSKCFLNQLGEFDNGETYYKSGGSSMLRLVRSF